MPPPFFAFVSTKKRRRTHTHTHTPSRAPRTWRIRGMLTQLAAATAMSGTKRPIMPWLRRGFRAMKRLNPTAVATDAAVAAT
jgi:hypothetical protein